MTSIWGSAQWLLIIQLCRVGGEEQSLLIRHWQPIPSPYSQTDSLGILMSCALYAFVNTKLHTACKDNNTAWIHREDWTDDPAQWLHSVNLGTIRDRLLIQVYKDPLLRSSFTKPFVLDDCQNVIMKLSLSLCAIVWRYGDAEFGTGRGASGRNA